MKPRVHAVRSIVLISFVTALLLVMTNIPLSPADAGPVMPGVSTFKGVEVADRSYALTLPPDVKLREEAYVVSVAKVNPTWGKALNAALNYKPRAGERFFKGHIVTKVGSTEVAMLGYNSLKMLYERSKRYEGIDWPEVTALQAQTDKADDPKSPGLEQITTEKKFSIASLVKRFLKGSADSDMARRPTFEKGGAGSRIIIPSPKVTMTTYSAPPHEIAVYFSEDMDPASVNDTSSFKLQTRSVLLPEGVEEVPGEWNLVQPRKAIFKPLVALVGGTLYAAKVTTGVRSALGKQLATPHRFEVIAFAGGVPGDNVNPQFDAEDYTGLMRYATELYRKGVFPLYPYLTPAKQQGWRDTCVAFAEVGAIELLSMNQPDLSEQNYFYHVYMNAGVGAWPGGKFGIGLESDWPYNFEACGDLYGKRNAAAIKRLRNCDTSFTSFGAITASYEISRYSRAFDISQAGADPSGEWLCKVDDDSWLFFGWENIPDIQAVPLDSNGAPVVGNACVSRFGAYPSAATSPHGRCYIMKNFSNSPKEDTELLKGLLNTLKYPVEIIVPIDAKKLNLDEIEHYYYGNVQSRGFPPEAMIDFGLPMYHALLAVGFIPKEAISKYSFDHPNFKADENYFIVKNSWLHTGDNGFLYIPESMMKRALFDMVAFKYDRDSEYFSDCPKRPYAGLGYEGMGDAISDGPPDEDPSGEMH